MPVLFIRADCIERLHAEDSNQRTENIGLLVVEIDEFGQFPLDVVDGLAYCDKIQPGRQ